MPRLIIVSLGTLGGALLESVARRGFFDEIVVATRNVEGARAKANNARVGAALEGLFPDIRVVRFDMHADHAGSQLADMGGDVVFAAPSMLPWWKLDRLSSERRAIVAGAPFATFTACHLAPMLALRKAWEQSGSQAAWVGASSPDVVNHVLHLTGMAPVCGTGNVAEVIPKIRTILARELELKADVFDVRLVAQHAFEYYCYAESEPEEAPPYLLSATFDDRDLTEIVNETLFEPYPIPYGLDFNLITVSASVRVLEALCRPEPFRAHVPAPAGLPGGYPVTVSRDGVALDLAAHWTLAQAEATNRESLPFDGIEQIDADGTIWFTPQTVAALHTIVGRKVANLRVEEAAGVADELVARLQ